MKNIENYNYDDVEQMYPDKRFEIINGKLYLMSPVSNPQFAARIGSMRSDLYAKGIARRAGTFQDEPEKYRYLLF